MPHVSHAARKLQVLCGHLRISAAELAKRLGVSASAVSDWSNGKGGADPGHVPESSLQLLSIFLRDQLKGAYTEQSARALWLGSYADFLHALAGAAGLGLSDLLAHTKRTPMLQFIPCNRSRLDIVRFTPNAQTSHQAAIGDYFAFAVCGAPDAELLLLAESAVGWHLGVPRENAPARLDAKGSARLPNFPGAYQFEPPAGVHRFHLLAIKARTPLSIVRSAGSTAPLSEQERNTLARELCNTEHVATWAYDVLEVDVH